MGCSLDLCLGSSAGATVPGEGELSMPYVSSVSNNGALETVRGARNSTLLSPTPQRATPESRCCRGGCK